MPANIEKIDTKLNKLERILKLLDEELVSKEDFVKSFENAVNLILRIEQDLITKNQANQQRLEDLIERLGTKHEGMFGAATASMGARIDQALKDQDGGMKFIYDKVSRLEDDIADKAASRIVIPEPPKLPKLEPEQPEQLRDKLELLKGENRLDIEAIRGWEDEIEKIKKEMEETKRSIGNTRIGRFFGGTPHNLLQTIDVSSQINGTTREFTGLPTARFYPFAFSSQSPFMLLPSLHYSIGRNAITILNNLEILQAGVGQFLIVAFIK